MDSDSPDYINVPPPTTPGAEKSVSMGQLMGHAPPAPPSHISEEPANNTYAFAPVPVPVRYDEKTAITSQPIINEMDYGTQDQTVPPGLESLIQVGQLILKQKVERAEAFFGCETKNKYKVKDSNGRDLYVALEETNCCTRNCCGSRRPFEIKIKDSSNRDVIHLSRHLACGSCLFPCCLQGIEVFAPPGEFIGTVEQEWTFCSPQFVVKNAQGNVVLRIDGPFCTYSVCGSVEFQVMSKDGSTQVGKISKQWSSLLREAFTDADNFGISFPMGLDVKMKAVMLGACFLIDFMYYENSYS